MNANQEVIVLEKLRNEIAAKLNWGDPLSWTHSRYESLAELIFLKTKVQLGTNTLKRFFGKIESNSLPGKTTKDVLAQIVGYSSYMEFYSGQTESVVKSKKINWKPVLSGIIVLFILGILVWSISLIKHKMSQDNLSGSLMVKYKIGTIPFTQTFFYKTQGVTTDSIHIIERGKPPMVVATKDSIKNLMHLIPGKRMISLVAGDKILSSVTYNVITHGWVFVYPHSTYAPRYFIQIDTVKKGYLQISKKELNSAKITLTEKEPFISYLNFKDFGVDGNNFSFNTRLKNPKNFDEKICQEVIIIIKTDTSGYYLTLTQKGCELYNKFYFGEKKMDGSTTELNQLSVNLDEWQDIKIVAQQGACKLYINNKEVVSESFQMPLGKINGIVFQFRGCGMVDEMEILNGDGVATYKQSFGDLNK